MLGLASVAFALKQRQHRGEAVAQILRLLLCVAHHLSPHDRRRRGHVIARFLPFAEDLGAGGVLRELAAPEGAGCVEELIRDLAEQGGAVAVVPLSARWMQAKLDLDAALQNVQDFHATRRNAQGRRQTLDEQVAERGHVGLYVRKAVAVDVECSFSRQQRGLRCHRCLSLGRQLRGPICIGLGRQLGSFLLLCVLLHYLRLGQQRLLRPLLQDDRSEPQSPSRRGAAARRRVRHLRLLGSHRRSRLAPVHRRRR
mmetsp:Transcript_93541/g.238147  ORF Transcript_93541/g.238147 Transcript_93541/m.238147 type:complete len:255 (-) Transcript_93541:678-1442(-)